MTEMIIQVRVVTDFPKDEVIRQFQSILKNEPIKLLHLSREIEVKEIQAKVESE